MNNTNGNLLAGKTIIVTGANSGIGKETAKALALRGARVVLACRSAERGEEAKREILSSSPNADISVQILDLSSLQSVKQFADSFCASESRLDILVNNAGVMAGERRLTKDGFEMDFGTNHLGHFYLTYLLLDKLKASAPSRVINISGDIYKYQGKLDFEDLQLTKNWSALAAYSKSKTANILHAVHLAKILKGTGVTTYSLHPGVIRTGLNRDAAEHSCFISCFTKCCCCIYVSKEEGIKTTLYCCIDSTISNSSGGYYRDCKEVGAESFATDPQLALQLWNISAQLCGVPADVNN